MQVKEAAQATEVPVHGQRKRLHFFEWWLIRGLLASMIVKATRWSATATVFRDPITEPSPDVPAPMMP